MSDKLFPSKNRRLLVEVFWTEGDKPFICGINGPTTIAALLEIENEISEWDNQPRGDGLYLFVARYEHPQVDEFGRIELPGYWDLKLMGFLSLESEESDDE